METVEKRSRDNVRWGALLGLVAPLVVLAILLLVAYLRLQEGDSFSFYLRQPMVLARNVTLAALADGLLFYFAIRKEHYKTARGLLGATIIYALVVLIFTLRH